MTILRRLAFSITFLAACLPEAGPTSTGDIIQVTLCPAGGPVCDPANLIADGATPIGVAISTPEKMRASDLVATVTLSAGAWLDGAAVGPQMVAQAQLGAQGTQILAFRPPTAVGPLEIDAELGGFRTAAFVYLRGTPLAAPALEVTPGSIGTDNTIHVIAHVRAAGPGAPSNNSFVTFSVTSTAPADGLAFFSPSTAMLTPDGTASAALFVEATVTAVNASITASSPDLISTAQSTITLARQ